MRPWKVTSDRKPWMKDKPKYGDTRHEDKRYHTQNYRDRRILYLQSHPLCEMCSTPERSVKASVIDHIIPVADGGEFWEDNWQALCTRCHRIKTNQDIAKRK